MNRVLMLWSHCFWSWHVSMCHEITILPSLLSIQTTAKPLIIYHAAMPSGIHLAQKHHFWIKSTLFSSPLSMYRTSIDFFYFPIPSPSFFFLDNCPSPAPAWWWAAKNSNSPSKGVPVWSRLGNHGTHSLKPYGWTSDSSRVSQSPTPLFFAWMLKERSSFFLPSLLW